MIFVVIGLISIFLVGITIMSMCKSASDADDDMEQLFRETKQGDIAKR